MGSTANDWVCEERAQEEAMSQLEAAVDGDDTPSQVLVADRLETRCLNEALESLLVRELADGLDQVLVALAIVCHHPPDLRERNESLVLFGRRQPPVLCTRRSSA